MLLRIDFKLKLVTMLPLAAWAWLMHFADLEFQNHARSSSTNSIFSPGLLLDVACVMFFVGVPDESVHCVPWQNTRSTRRKTRGLPKQWMSMSLRTVIFQPHLICAK